MNGHPLLLLRGLRDVAIDGNVIVLLLVEDGEAILIRGDVIKDDGAIDRAVGTVVPWGFVRGFIRGFIRGCMGQTGEIKVGLLCKGRSGHGTTYPA